MENKLLLISKQADDQAFATEVAAVGGLAFKSLDSVRSLGKEFENDRQTLFLIDVSTEELIQEFLEGFATRVGSAPGQIHASQVHLLCSDALDRLEAVANRDCFGHLVVNKYPNPQEAGKYYGKIVAGMCLKRVYGLSEVFFPAGTPLDDATAIPKVFKINHSTEKFRVLERARSFIDIDGGSSPRITELMMNALDELLMNAIYDAPKNPDGTQLYAQVSRNTPITLDEKSSVEFQMVLHPDGVALKVIDNFGSLNKTQLLKHLIIEDSKEEFEVQDAVANAGVGLLTTFRVGGSFAFVSTPGVRTEVMIFFKVGKSFKDFKNQFRFITIHVREN